MSEPLRYPKRLIEVDLPIRRISVQARRDKSIRQGHISTLHVWWARRPLAACRAVICATIWLDPAGDGCPPAYSSRVGAALKTFAKAAIGDRDAVHLLGNSYDRWKRVAQLEDYVDLLDLRESLLDFIALFSDWDAASSPVFLAAADSITLISHEAIGGIGQIRPLVVDPFAGGGAIPLEALRLGADAFASDLNPVSVLLNRVVLEYIPSLGLGLKAEVDRWGKWVEAEAKRRLGKFYPSDTGGSTPIAYLWARTIRCEGPSCGKPLPLVRSFWLTKRDSGSIAVDMRINDRSGALVFSVQESPKADAVPQPTVRKGGATCPRPGCGHTTPVANVRKQLTQQHGGADDATLFAVVGNRASGGRFYRAPTTSDTTTARQAGQALAELRALDGTLIPDETLPPKGTLGFRVQAYGVTKFEHLYTSRQNLALGTFAKLIKEVEEKASTPAVAATLSLALGRLQDLNSSLCRWADTVVGANAGQNRVSMTWDFAEACPLAGAGGSWSGQVDWILRVIEHTASTVRRPGTVCQAAAQEHPLPDDSADALITDPPYYNAFGYADLSDLFFVWLKRTTAHPETRFTAIGRDGKTPKAVEIVVNPGAASDGRGLKDHGWFHQEMRRAFVEARRIVHPSGLGVVVFAHKDTSSWEALLSSVIEAGWAVTASWPIDTERPARQRAIGSAALASSVHLVCRPREYAAGSSDEPGDWRDVLRELPGRIHEWMPRLSEEGVVGADAIFACLGPALEIFSRYPSVEKASGEVVTLKEYLEHVWAAVSKEALSIVFADAETAGLEPNARVTAMWLWTLSAKRTDESHDEANGEDDEPIDDEDEPIPTDGKAMVPGFLLEYDAARKIAQGLGGRIEELGGIVEVKGDKARLLSVAERAAQLFGKEKVTGTAVTKERSKKKQTSLFVEFEEVVDEDASLDGKSASIGTTALDRVHQAMLLFGAGRSEALKRFLTEQGVGAGIGFWKLAQALSALYPAGTDEKRWVDGVLARKKGLGFG